MAVVAIGLAVSWSGAQEGATFRISARQAREGAVRFDYRVPARAGREARVLVLLPGFNGDGGQLLAGFWGEFADREGVILLAPTFQATKSEIENRKGYYYPAEWSGGVLLRALDELRRRTGCETDTVFLCGHSAGAHFAHRFALWRPDRVAAFAAYSAAWWDEPTAEMKQVPALIMCGEADLRYETTLEFLQQGLAQDSPWVWRGYAATGHEMTPAVQRMAAVFLEHYFRGEKDEPFVGDLQTYDVLPWAEREEIPEVARVRLPSRRVAETWRLEE